MLRASPSAAMTVPVAWRRKRLPRLRMLWRLRDTGIFTLPDAVRRNRFLAPLLVFNLGILSSFQILSAPLGALAGGLPVGCLGTAMACPFRQAARKDAGLYRRGQGNARLRAGLEHPLTPTHILGTRRCLRGCRPTARS